VQKLNILVIGGTGFIGSTVSLVLLRAGHNVAVLSRRGAADSLLRQGIRTIRADAGQPGAWQDEVSRFEAVINLSGTSIFRRWTGRGRREIRDTRIKTTSNIVDTIKCNPGKVQQFFSVSGVGYYGFHGDEVLDEGNPSGSDFIAGVAARWEAEAQRVRDTGIRLVICRLGHVLGPGGGALPRLATLARLRLGSGWGNGSQWISWVHQHDLARAFIFLLDSPGIGGAVNITSPHPVRNRDLMQTLTRITRSRPVIPPVPAFALRLMLGQFSSVFLNGQRVVPRVLQENGFEFKFALLEQALSDLYGS